MFASREKVLEALAALGLQMEQMKAPQTHLVVCGSSGLFAMGAMTREVTKDIDVLGTLDLTPGTGPVVRKSQPLPAHVVQASKVVGRDLRLPEGWINAGPTDLVDFGLPAGLTGRLHPMTFGTRLVVHFVDRWDQIHFKL